MSDWLTWAVRIIAAVVATIALWLILRLFRKGQDADRSYESNPPTSPSSDVM
jgi:hypothetical protein